MTKSGNSQGAVSDHGRVRLEFEGQGMRKSGVYRRRGGDVMPKQFVGRLGLCADPLVDVEATPFIAAGRGRVAHRDPQGARLQPGTVEPGG